MAPSTTVQEAAAKELASFITKVLADYPLPSLKTAGLGEIAKHLAIINTGKSFEDGRIAASAVHESISKTWLKLKDGTPGFKQLAEEIKVTKPSSGALAQSHGIKEAPENIARNVSSYLSGMEAQAKDLEKKMNS